MTFSLADAVIEEAAAEPSDRLLPYTAATLPVSLALAAWMGRLISQRARDAGLRRRIAYLGIMPLIGVFIWIFLMFKRSAATSAASTPATTGVPRLPTVARGRQQAAAPGKGSCASPAPRFKRTVAGPPPSAYLSSWVPGTAAPKLRSNGQSESGPATSLATGRSP